MRKIILSITMLITVFVLSGCVNSDITLDIDKKGNISVSAQVLSSEYLMKGINEEKLKNSYDKVEKINESGKSGYKITEDLGNISDLKVSENKKISKYSDLIKIDKKEKFIYDIYGVNINIKDYMQRELSKEELSMLGLFGSGFDVKMHLNTPLKLVESNATSSIEKDGIHTYNWDYSLDNLENINAKVRIPNIQNMLLLGVGILIVVVLSVFIIKKRKG